MRKTLIVVLMAHLVLISRGAWSDEVTQLVLIDAATDLDLFVLTDGAVIDLDVVGTELNVRADTDPAVTGSVRFDLDAVVGYRIENVAPYALEGDQGGDYSAVTYTLGMHTLTATAFTGGGASGVPGPGLTVNFEVVSSSMPRILIYYETAGFVHANQITAGLAMFADIAAQEGHQLVTTGDSAGFFTPTSLATFDAVVFLNTSGDILDTSEEAAFEAYMAAGGAYVGIHSASDTEYGWSYYGTLLGTWFSCHPPGTSPAVLNRLTRHHPSTAHLAPTFPWTDEWYNFQSNPSFDVETTLLVTVDETTYVGGLMGDPHPISWAREIGGGRVWYTALGHNVASYTEPFFIDHVRGGLLWTLVESGEFRRGDVNGDGALNLTDVIADLFFLFAGAPMVGCEDASDVNDDGNHDLADSVTLLNYLFTGGPPPQPPFPACGSDPTPDLVPCAGQATCP